MARGRPSTFTQALADTICDRLAEGESLRSICKADDMPTKGVVFRWLANNQAFSDQYAKARESQADALFDEIIDIADNGEEDARRSALRIDARKWVAGKLRPKVYSDKGQTVTTEVNVQTAQPAHHAENAPQLATLAKFDRKQASVN